MKGRKRDRVAVLPRWGRGALLAAVALCAVGAVRSQAPSPGASRSGEAGWLARGSVEERFAVVASQLRGFDVAMVEVGYRYGELYWAGRDGNWEFSAYQIEKIRTAMRNAIQRRPARGASAQVLEGVIPGVEAALRARDRGQFTRSFDALTQSCNACHKAERVGFITVAPPSIRHSVVSSGPSTPSTR